jgi:hypothetical protein
MIKITHVNDLLRQSVDVIRRHMLPMLHDDSVDGSSRKVPTVDVHSVQGGIPPYDEYILAAERGRGSLKSQGLALYRDS